MCECACAIVIVVQCRFGMHGSPNNLEISFQFYMMTLGNTDWFKNAQNRQFLFDKPYLDHFNLVPSNVGGVSLQHEVLLVTCMCVIVGRRYPGNRTHRTGWRMCRTGARRCL